jgi:TrmH family RNA methyltransferase
MNENKSSRGSVEQTLKRIRALSRSRMARQQEGLFWLEGVRHFVQACDARLVFDTVIYAPVLLKSRLAEMLIRRLGAQGVRRQRVGPEQFRSISTTERASGIGAIVREHWTPLAIAQPDRGLCWLVTEEVRSPGNLGTILRTAEACGAAGMIFVGPQCDPFAPDVVRASMGGILHLGLVRATHDQVEQWASRGGVQLVGLSPNSEQLWTALPPAARVAIVLGEERRGLSDRLSSLCHTTVCLPMTGHADSLNVGVAAGVMMYELVRRRMA